MEPISRNGRSELTRRGFIKTGGAVVAGLAAGRLFAQDKAETLAVKGGPKTVTFPSAEVSALTRWPRYGDAEKKRLHELIDGNRFYEELPLFEKEWKVRCSPCAGQIWGRIKLAFLCVAGPQMRQKGTGSAGEARPLLPPCRVPLSSSFLSALQA